MASEIFVFAGGGALRVVLFVLTILFEFHWECFSLVEGIRLISRIVRESKLKVFGIKEKKKKKKENVNR